MGQEYEYSPRNLTPLRTEKLHARVFFSERKAAIALLDLDKNIRLYTSKDTLSVQASLEFVFAARPKWILGRSVFASLEYRCSSECMTLVPETLYSADQKTHFLQFCGLDENEFVSVDRMNSWEAVVVFSSKIYRETKHTYPLKEAFLSYLFSGVLREASKITTPGVSFILSEFNGQYVMLLTSNGKPIRLLPLDNSSAEETAFQILYILERTNFKMNEDKCIHTLRPDDHCLAILQEYIWNISSHFWFTIPASASMSVEDSQLCTLLCL